MAYRTNLSLCSLYTTHGGWLVFVENVFRPVYLLPVVFLLLLAAFYFDLVNIDCQFFHINNGINEKSTIMMSAYNYQLKAYLL